MLLDISSSHTSPRIPRGPNSAASPPLPLSSPFLRPPNRVSRARVKGRGSRREKNPDGVRSLCFGFAGGSQDSRVWFREDRTGMGRWGSPGMIPGSFWGSMYMGLAPPRRTCRLMQGVSEAFLVFCVLKKSLYRDHTAQCFMMRCSLQSRYTTVDYRGHDSEVRTCV